MMMEGYQYDEGIAGSDSTGAVMSQPRTFSCMETVTKLSSHKQQRFMASWRALSQELGNDLRDDSRLAFEFCSGNMPSCWTAAWVADEIRANARRHASAHYQAIVRLCVVHIHDWLVRTQIRSFQDIRALANHAPKMAKRHGTAMARCFFESQTNFTDVLAELHEHFPLEEIK